VGGTNSFSHIYYKLKMKPIFTYEILDKVETLKDIFQILLDEDGENISGELRVKLAKAELVLNKIGELINLELEP